MNHENDEGLDRDNYDILSYEIPDEALERAAGVAPQPTYYCESKAGTHRGGPCC